MAGKLLLCSQDQYNVACLICYVKCPHQNEKKKTEKKKRRKSGQKQIKVCQLGEGTDCFEFIEVEIRFLVTLTDQYDCVIEDNS